MTVFRGAIFLILSLVALLAGLSACSGSNSSPDETVSTPGTFNLALQLIAAADSGSAKY